MTRSFSGFLERLKVWARTADQHRLAALLVMALAAMTVQLYPLSQQPQVALSQQVKRLNTDAKLYWGLAQNLANGTGFHDNHGRSAGRSAAIMLDRRIRYTAVDSYHKRGQGRHYNSIS